MDFLKNEYGIGGYSVHASRELDIWADGKGIKITAAPDITTVLTWAKAAKRIGELIAADRYLSPAEKEKYPAYREQREVIAARTKISGEFRSIISDYKDYVTQLGESDKTVDRWYLVSCADSFSSGEKKMYARTSEGDFILPIMRDAMQTIIGENTHLTERCEAVLAELSGPLAAPLEPTYDELNPSPPPKKEYRFSLGDTVYLGTQEYELLAFDEQTVRLFDQTFPLINKEMPRTDFDRMLAENPLNDHLLQVVEESPAPEPVQEDAALEKAKALINEYCVKTFGQERDSFDLHYVDLAFSSTSDGENFVSVGVDLIDCRLIYQVDRVDVVSIQCHDLDELCGHLANLDFDEMIAFTEEQYRKQQEREGDDFSDVDPAAVRAALAENGIVDGQVVDPEKLDANPFIQQVIADVEQIAANTPQAHERFSVIETEKGYAIWDDVRDEIYVDGNGIQEEFTSEWQAEDYLKQVRKVVADKEAAEWLAVEWAKQENPSHVSADDKM